MIRAVVDTNVVLSGLLFGGVPLRVLKAAYEHQFTWVTSNPLLSELTTLLSSRKFAIHPNEIEELMTPMLEVVEIVVPRKKIRVIRRCDGDNRVLECAAEGTCDFIVTGDRRDLLSLIKYEGIAILNSRDFLETLPDLSN